MVKYASMSSPSVSLASLISSAPPQRREGSSVRSLGPARPSSTRPVRVSTCRCIRRRLSACCVACSFLSSASRSRHWSSLAATSSPCSSSSLCRACSSAAARLRWHSISLSSWKIVTISPSAGCCTAVRASPPVFPSVSPTSTTRCVVSALHCEVSFSPSIVNL